MNRFSTEIEIMGIARILQFVFIIGVVLVVMGFVGFLIYDSFRQESGEQEFKLMGLIGIGLDNCNLKEMGQADKEGKRAIVLKCGQREYHGRMWKDKGAGQMKMEVQELGLIFGRDLRDGE